MSRSLRSKPNSPSLEQMRIRQTAATGLLKAAGVYNELCSACAILERNGDGSVKGMSLSISWDHVHDAVEEAVLRFAEEQCMVADVRRRGDALVVDLRPADTEEYGQ
jgi:hypothetical protein